MARDHDAAGDGVPADIDDQELPGREQPDPERVDPERVRAALGRLAGDEPLPPSVVRRAEVAIEDLERAAGFVDAGGLGELEAAIERTGDEDLAARGEQVRDAFRRFRAAAAGELAPIDPERQPVDPGRQSLEDGDDGYFHRGRGTDLRRDGEATST